MSDTLVVTSCQSNLASHLRGLVVPTRNELTLVPMKGVSVWHNSQYQQLAKCTILHRLFKGHMLAASYRSIAHLDALLYLRKSLLRYIDYCGR